MKIFETFRVARNANKPAIAGYWLYCNNTTTELEKKFGELRLRALNEKQT